MHICLCVYTRPGSLPSMLLSSVCVVCVCCMCVLYVDVICVCCMLLSYVCVVCCCAYHFLGLSFALYCTSLCSASLFSIHLLVLSRVRFLHLCVCVCRVLPLVSRPSACVLSLFCSHSNVILRASSRVVARAFSAVPLSLSRCRAGSTKCRCTVGATRTS